LPDPLEFAKAATWAQLLLFGSVSSLGVAVVAIALGFTQVEQHTIIFKPAHRLYESITSFVAKARS